MFRKTTSGGVNPIREAMVDTGLKITGGKKRKLNPSSTGNLLLSLAVTVAALLIVLLVAGCVIITKSYNFKVVNDDTIEREVTK